MSQSLTCAVHLHSVTFMTVTRILLILSLLLLPFGAHAVRVPGLYEAEVPVEGQQAGSRAEAIRTAMKMVLIKLTGDRTAPLRPEVSTVVQAAERYVQQYRYVEAAQAVTTDTLGTEVQLRLKITFAENDLNDALRQSGIQIWGRERPSVLIWLAMEKDQQRKLLLAEEEPEYLFAVNRQAEARGIPLMHPLFDLQDTSSLQAADIRAGFRDTIQRASARYYPDTLLTGWLETLLPGIWQARWMAIIGNEQYDWTTEGSYPETVLTEGIDGMADRIAERFARQDDSGMTEITLKVLDIKSVGHYAKVLSYLQSLSAVSHVDVSGVNSGEVEFRLTAHGSETAVTQAIGFGRVLEPVAANNTMYRFIP